MLTSLPISIAGSTLHQGCSWISSVQDRTFFPMCSVKAQCQGRPCLKLQSDVRISPGRADLCKTLRGSKTVPVERRSASIYATVAPPQSVATSPPKSRENSLPTFDTEPASSQLAPDNFVWEKNWYPLFALDDIDPSKPHPAMVLGKELVVFCDTEGSWHCLQDKCPHRLAPLSEGRVMDGMLMCSYHGWKVRPDGKIGSIPQAGMDVVPLDSPIQRRACTQSYPVQAAHGLLWIWPDAAPEAFIESAASPVAMCPDVTPMQPGDLSVDLGRFYVRDMPLPFDILVENIHDQSHVPFAHHGVASSRNTPWATHFQIDRLGPAERFRNKGHAFDLEWSPDGRNKPYKQRVSFCPPGYVEFYTPRPKGFTVLYNWIVPVDAHSCRLITHTVDTQPLPGFVKWLVALRPRWVDHLVLSAVFDGDLAYLVKAAWNVKQQEDGGEKWNKYYFMPANADKSTVAWRKWLAEVGRGGPWSPQQVLQQLPQRPHHRDILDRFEQHTKSCASCSKALRTVRKGQPAAKVLAGIIGAAWLAANSAILNSSGLAELPLWQTGLSAASVLGLLAISKAMHTLETRLTYTDYIHADH
ncbi:hypothetical protein WJX74_003218 [Apatococcus lobatus]|uniref:Rieske domain-containing protein n=1 Tax=Apatococcus lobatus TaxID=904363 RepID=A0AAW1S2M4_9CHLO